jgi:serine/threonine protein phosphatase PrpC
MRMGHFTDAGPKDENQDFHGMRVPEGSLLASRGIAACIADGVSAASAAREAAETCVCGFLNDYFETPESWDVVTAGQRVIAAINRWLYSQGQGYSSIERGCVTTFTVVVFLSDAAHVFHIGDSRLYLLRDGTLEQLTRDHSAMVSSETSYLTRAMGITLSPRIDYQSLAMCPGDLFALTTDGIHDFLPISHFRSILDSSDDPRHIATNLGAATAHSDDNRSCLLIRIDELSSSELDQTPDDHSGLTLSESLTTESDAISGFLRNERANSKHRAPGLPERLRDDPQLFWKILSLTLFLALLVVLLTR